jgi:hypothetical protein
MAWSVNDNQPMAPAPGFDLGLMKTMISQDGMPQHQDFAPRISWSRIPQGKAADFGRNHARRRQNVSRSGRGFRAGGRRQSFAIGRLCAAHQRKEGKRLA